MSCELEQQLELGLEVPLGERSVPKLNRRLSHTFRFAGSDVSQQAPLLVPTVPEFRLPDDHFVRHLRRLVGEVLGKELRSRCVMWGGYDYDPVAMFSVMLYALMLGERSLRRMEDLCTYDARFRFLSGGVQPDFTTFHRFRRGLDEDLGLDKMFRLVVERAKTDGLVKGRTAFIDGTKIPTSGSQWRKWLDEAEAQALEEGLAPQGEGTVLPDAKPPEPQAIEAVVPAQSKASAPPAAKAASKKPKRKFKAPSDKDARTMKTTHGEFVTGYNCQLAVDPQAGIVIGAVPITAPNDWNAVAVLLETTEMHSGIKPKRLVADKGFESAGNMQTAQAAGIKTYFCPKALKDPPFKPDKDGTLRCLAGHTPSQNTTTKRGVPYTVYKVSQCRNCPLRQACGKPLKGDQREMNVRSDEHIALSTANRKRSKSQAGKKLLKQRGQTVELPNARIKRDYRMRRFNLSGIDGARLELLLACVALNLETIIKAALDRLRAVFIAFNAIICIFAAATGTRRPMQLESI